LEERGIEANKKQERRFKLIVTRSYLETKGEEQREGEKGSVGFGRSPGEHPSREKPVSLALRREKEKMARRLQSISKEPMKRRGKRVRRKLRT